MTCHLQSVHPADAVVAMLAATTMMGVFFEDGKVLTDQVLIHPSEQEYGEEIQRYVTVFDDIGDPDKAYESFKEFKDAVNALIDEISQSIWP